MGWISFALLTAFSRSLTDVAGKTGLKKVDEYIVVLAMYLFSLPFIAVALYFTGIPKLETNFWIALPIGALLNIVANVLYMRAIKTSDLSLSIPLITFTPLFMLMTSPIILGEFPGPYGIIGIVLIVAGAYLLNVRHAKKGLLAPFRALLKTKGPRLMLAVAFIWSISSNFDKMGIQGSSALFWAFFINLAIAVGTLPLVLIYSRKHLPELKKQMKPLLAVGFFNGLTIIFQMIAVSMTLVAYVIAIKRSSAVMSVLMGALFFKEKGIKERLLGAIIMILGVLFISLIN